MSSGGLLIINIRAIIELNMSLDGGSGGESSSVVLTANTTFRVLACAGMCWRVPAMPSEPAVPKRIEQ